MSMGTVAKPAQRRQLGNLGEQRIYSIGNVADIELPYTRRVYDPAAA